MGRTLRALEEIESQQFSEDQGTERHAKEVGERRHSSELSAVFSFGRL
jgi:hypothetical protein